jgi:tRNA G18 (ribose-2'-O)-methylase SpoU
VAKLVEISSVDDPRLSDYRALTDVELRRRTEPRAGLFIAEGELVIRRAARAGYRLRSVLTSKRWVSGLADVLDSTDIEVFVGSADLLEQVTGFHVHRGALASVERKVLPAPSEVAADANRLLVLEDVNSHTNLGAIFRSAAGLGMDGVLLSPSCTDPLYRRAVRVSMGEVFAVPYARLEPWPAGLSTLRDAGFVLLALTPDESAVSIDQLDVAAMPRVALLLGAEGPGLSRSALSGADLRVRIPMARDVDSLNVGAAAAVACYAVRRMNTGSDRSVTER